MAYTYPESISKLIEQFGSLPGIGARSATRIVSNLFNQNSGKDLARGLIVALTDSIDNTRNCNNCGTIVESPQQLCSICQDSNRVGKLMVVENVVDLVVVESTGKYNGRYHVLNGLVSPLRGVSLEELNTRNILGRVSNEEINEIIFALPSSVEGDTTTLLIKQLISSRHEDVEFTRLGRGLPSGANIEYLDPETLKNSLQNKTQI